MQIQSQDLKENRNSFLLSMKYYLSHDIVYRKGFIVFLVYTNNYQERSMSLAVLELGQLNKNYRLNTDCWYDINSRLSPLNHIQRSAKSDNLRI